MREPFLILERSIQNDLAAIEKLYAAIGKPTLTEDTPEETLIVVAYRLHNLYNAFENMFRNIAATFENRLDDASGWHSQLLQRMCLDLMPVRPAVIDAAAYAALDELRRFRHLFRSAYGVDLDAARLRLVVDKALQLQAIYRAQLDHFLAFLHTLATDEV